MSSKEKSDATVPTWDGSSRTWRRYVKENGWFIGSTKASQRKYVASRLISRLTGSARLLAMSWSQREFEGEQGVMLLQTFFVFPISEEVAAIMHEYFPFVGDPLKQLGSSLCGRP